MLLYSVEDNGSDTIVNDEVENLKKGKKRSLGMSLTSERLDVLNKTKGTQAAFKIEDLKDKEGRYAGKKVVLSLPYEEEN